MSDLPVGSDRTLYDWFRLSVRRYPDAPAVQLGELCVSYQGLHGCALTLAEQILRECGGTPRRVALLASRSLVALAGYLATLRLGATVVPLNPSFPASRNRTSAELSEVDLVLADEAGTSGWHGETPDGETPDGETPDGRASLPGVLQVGDAELLAASTAAPRTAHLPQYQGSSNDIAYILFTSGSTGRPKGVPIRHRHAAPYVARNIARYQVGPGCRMSHTFDLTFDPSVFDLFVTWGGGATLVVPAAADLLSPVEYLTSNRITHWFSVPSVVSVSAELGSLPAGAVEDLRFGTFIGEQLSYQQARRWHTVAPAAAIENVYGPTELAIACTSYRLDAAPSRWPDTSNGTVPIGPVYDFLESVVLDERGAPAEDGELCVRGPQRFDGYLDPTDDVGRFLTYDGLHTAGYDGSSPLTDSHYYRTGDRVRFESGHLVHLGRLDNQLKVRGYRVELGEIEAVLRGHPQVGQAVVVAVRDGAQPGSSEQVALVGCYTGAELPPRALVRWLRRRLPMHMVPRRFHHLDAVPLNANGKTDRGALRDLVLAGQPRQLTGGAAGAGNAAGS